MCFLLLFLGRLCGEEYLGLLLLGWLLLWCELRWLVILLGLGVLWLRLIMLEVRVELLLLLLGLAVRLLGHLLLTILLLTKQILLHLLQGRIKHLLHHLLHKHHLRIIALTTITSAFAVVKHRHIV